MCPSFLCVLLLGSCLQNSKLGVSSCISCKIPVFMFYTCGWKSQATGCVGDTCAAMWSRASCHADAEQLLHFVPYFFQFSQKYRFSIFIAAFHNIIMFNCGFPPDQRDKETNDKQTRVAWKGCCEFGNFQRYTSCSWRFPQHVNAHTAQRHRINQSCQNTFQLKCSKTE